MNVIALKSETLFMKMIRQERINIRSFPATIALEKVEARKGRDKLYTAATASVIRNSFDDFESFPVIEWSDNDEEHTPLQMGWNHFDSLAANDFQTSLTRSQKRTKVSSDSFVSVSPDRLNGLLRSQRIPTGLHELEYQSKENKVSPCTSTLKNASDRRSLLAPFQPSFFSSTNDVNLEKILQLNFCENEESNQVMLVA